MTLNEFIEKIIKVAERDRKLYKELRLGQAVFNVVDKYIGVARKVQFDYGIDCFYNDSYINEFLTKCWEIEPVLHNAENIDFSPHCLAETIPYMMTNDWKMRLLAEFFQLKLRYNALKFTKFKQDELVQMQLICMEEYAEILEKRIKQENIEIF